MARPENIPRSRLNVAEMAAVEFVSAAVDDDQVGFRTGLLAFAEAEPALFPHVAEPQNGELTDTLMLSLKHEQSHYLESLYSLLEQCQWNSVPGNRYVPLPIIMYQKYMELYPQRLNQLCSHSKQAPFLGTKLIQGNFLSDREQVEFLVYTCLSPKWDPVIWIPLLESVSEQIFQEALLRIKHKIGDSSTHMYADLIDSAVEQERRIAMERLVEAAVWTKETPVRRIATESGPDVIEGEYNVENITKVLTNTLENIEITGKAIKPVIETLMKFRPDPLRVDKDKDKCAVELAEERGPAFTALAVMLFHQGCEMYNHDRQTMLKFLAQRKHTGDHTLRAIVCEEGKHFLATDLITTCAINGRAATSCELALQCSKCLSQSHEQTFMEILIHAQDGKVALAAFTQLTPDLYSMDCIDKNGNNALHIAGLNGFTALAKQILDDQGYSRLLWAKNLKCHYPVQVSLNAVMFDTAAVYLRSMNDWRLCVVSKRGNVPPAVDFQKLLFELAWAKSCKKNPVFNCMRSCLMKQQDDLVDIIPVTDYHLPLSQDKHHIEECILAILDSTVDRTHGVIHYDLLEADKNGYTPDQDKGYTFKEQGYNPSGHNCIEIVAKQDLEEVAAHESFHNLIKLKWQLFGWKWYLGLLLTYLLFFGLLTLSLVLAAEEENPSTYDKPLDRFRLFCEVVVILGVLVDFIGEIVDFCTNYDRSLRKYLTDWPNWFDMLAITTTLLIIPFRAVNMDVQWVFAALAYIFHGLRIFEYAIILRFFGRYVEILVRVVIRDLTQFLIVFMVFMVTFGGGMYFALRGIPCPLTLTNAEPGFNPLMNTSLCTHPDETGSIYRVWLTGIRLLAEGENIIFPYLFQERGFRGLAGVIYIVFLFLVVVILLNLLIAQFTKSYDEEIGRARVSVTLNRAKALSRMWNPLWMKIIVRYRDIINKYIQVSYYKSTSSKMDLEDLDEQKKQIHEVRQIIHQTTQSVHKQISGVMTQIEDHNELLMNQVTLIKEEQSQSIMQEEIVKDMESKLTQYYSSMTDMHETMMRKLRNDLRNQLREDLSLVISKELQEQAAVIKQQAAIMNDLQADLVRQTEMAREQQRLLKDEWMMELAGALRRLVPQSTT